MRDPESVWDEKAAWAENTFDDQGSREKTLHLIQRFKTNTMGQKQGDDADHIASRHR